MKIQTRPSQRKKLQTSTWLLEKSLSKTSMPYQRFAESRREKETYNRDFSLNDSTTIHILVQGQILSFQAHLLKHYDTIRAEYCKYGTASLPRHRNSTIPKRF